MYKLKGLIARLSCCAMMPFVAWSGHELGGYCRYPTPLPLPPSSSVSKTAHSQLFALLTSSPTSLLLPPHLTRSASLFGRLLVLPSRAPKPATAAAATAVSVKDAQPVNRAAPGSRAPQAPSRGAISGGGRWWPCHYVSTGAVGRGRPRRRLQTCPKVDGGSGEWGDSAAAAAATAAAATAAAATATTAAAAEAAAAAAAADSAAVAETAVLGAVVLGAVGAEPVVPGAGTVAATDRDSRLSAGSCARHASARRSRSGGRK